MIEYGVQLTHKKSGGDGKMVRAYYLEDRRHAEIEYGNLARDLSPDSWDIKLGYRTARVEAGEFRELGQPDRTAQVLSGLPDPAVISGILALAGVLVPPEVTALWTESERVLAVEWAESENLAVSGSEDVLRHRKPGFVTRAQEICGDLVQAQLALEAWTLRPAESDFMMEPAAAVRMAREALTAMAVLVPERRPAKASAQWRDKAMALLEASPEGLSAIQVKRGLGAYAPDHSVLLGWLQDGEAAGTLEHPALRTWKIRETA